MARPDAEVTSGFGFSLGFVSWVEANGWGALAFQAHVGVGGQSKTYSEVFQVIFAREAGWERPCSCVMWRLLGDNVRERIKKNVTGHLQFGVAPDPIANGTTWRKFQSHRIGDPAQAGDYEAMAEGGHHLAVGAPASSITADGDRVMTGGQSQKARLGDASRAKILTAE